MTNDWKSKAKMLNLNEQTDATKKKERTGPRREKKCSFMCVRFKAPGTATWNYVQEMALKEEQGRARKSD